MVVREKEKTGNEEDDGDDEYEYQYEYQVRVGRIHEGRRKAEFETQNYQLLILN